MYFIVAENKTGKPLTVKSAKIEYWDYCNGMFTYQSNEIRDSMFPITNGVTLRVFCEGKLIFKVTDGVVIEYSAGADLDKGGKL